MTDIIHHLGHEPSSVHSTGNTTWVTTEGTFDPDFSRCSAQLATPGAGWLAGIYVEIPEAGTDTSAFWVHLLAKFQSTNKLRENKLFRFSSGNYLTAEVLWGSISLSGLATWQLRLYQPGTSVSVTSDPIPFLDSQWDRLLQIDIELKTVSGNAVINVYLDGSDTPTASLTYTGYASGPVDRVSADINGVGGGDSLCISELAMTNFDTRNRRVATLPPTGAGHYTETTGGYENIDEIVPDALGAIFSEDGQRLTVTHDGLGAVPLVIDGVALVGVASTNGVGVLHPLLRIGGADYVISDPLADDTGVVPRCTVIMANPATNLPWSGDLAAVEIGAKVVAA